LLDCTDSLLYDIVRIVVLNKVIESVQPIAYYFILNKYEFIYFCYYLIPYNQYVKEIAENNGVSIEEVIKKVGTLQDVSECIASAISLTEWGRDLWVDKEYVMKKDQLKEKLNRDFINFEQDEEDRIEGEMEFKFEMLANMDYED
jgi:hypothetical protein